MRFLKKLLCLTLPTLLLAVSGCGGGSSDLSGTLALTVTAPADSTQSGTATATYSPAASGKNPVGLKISFSTDSSIIALDSTSGEVGSNGTATITFRALTVGTDTQAKIIASTGGLSQFQVVTIKATPGTVAAPVAPPTVSATPNSISFNKAEPPNITLKGMGGAGLVETSIVSFIVKDTADQPLADQTVDFSLNTTLGGLTITPTSAVSDSSGIVRTIVSSGIIATPVRVTASVRGTSPLISVQSDQLVVSTGIPAQDSLSISFSNLNSESWDVDGVNVDVTALLADHFHNPVPDGTSVYFTTIGGSIQPSCTTVGGACTVKWTSQDPRPGTSSAPTADIGRPVILAYAVGEENFIDSSGNGLADAGACTPITIKGVGQVQQCGEFVDTPEAYRDDNFDWEKNPLETYIDFNGNGVFGGPDGSYNGALRPASVPATVSKTKHIYKNSQIVMSTSGAIITTVPTSLAGPGTLVYTVRDENGNTMPSDTTITVTAPFGKLTGTTSFKIAQNTGDGETLSINLAATDSPKPQSGFIEIAVKTPRGLETKETVFVSGNF
ncbi:MAG: Ig domain-containing [Geobacteraceae bacterium]|nr:MAG: Ig domain-containing [Geobacteraceae bacterium]